MNMLTVHDVPSLLPNSAYLHGERLIFHYLDWKTVSFASIPRECQGDKYMYMERNRGNIY